MFCVPPPPPLALAAMYFPPTPLLLSMVMLPHLVDAGPLAGGPCEGVPLPPGHRGRLPHRRVVQRGRPSDAGLSQWQVRGGHCAGRWRADGRGGHSLGAGHTLWYAHAGHVAGLAALILAEGTDGGGLRKKDVLKAITQGAPTVGGLSLAFLGRKCVASMGG